MSNKQEEKTWDEYNKFYSYLEKNSELKEAFESGIKCFSSILRNTNPHYVLNITNLYLQYQKFLKYTSHVLK